MTKSVDRHLDGQDVAELRNFLLEDAAPTAARGFGYQSGRMQVHDGTSAKNVAYTDDIHGTYRGTHDATTGVPTPASSTVRTNDLIVAGEQWRVSVAGTMTGIEGLDDLQINDIVMALVDGASAAADFIGMEGNRAAAVGGLLEEAVGPTNIVAATPTDFTPATMSGGNIRAYTVVDASGNVLNDDMDEQIVAGPALRLTSLTAKSNITVHFVGSA